MTRALLVATFLFFSLLGFVYFFVGVPKIYIEDFYKESSPHVYENPNEKIKQIDIFVIYFIPANKVDKIRPIWREIIKESLEELSQFHDLQFSGLSDVRYHLYPKPVIGRKVGLEYDTENTQGGNPYGLLNISEELSERIFDIKGDLFLPEFFSIGGKESYPVLGIVYEGVGASGGVIYSSESETISDISKETGLPQSVIHVVDVDEVEGFFLTNIFFLEEGRVEGAKNSIFAHEFYHTVGLPDAYESPGEYDAPTSQDIMGMGRFKPIENTYIDKDILKHLGI